MLVAKQNRKEIYPMQSIPQLNNLRNNFQNISLNIHKISSFLNMLDVLDETPNEIISAFSDPVIADLVSKTNENISELNKRLYTYNNTIKKAIYKQHSNRNRTEPYAGFSVDEKPILSTIRPVNSSNNVPISFLDINNDYIKNHGRSLKPINRKRQINYKGNCIFCGAPNEYLYNNNNGEQCKCKACQNTFNVKTHFKDELGAFCPHCKHKLEVRKDRNNYLIYRCPNDNCSFYLNNKQSKDISSIKDMGTGETKLRYIYRGFKFTLEDVKSNHELKFDTKISLNRAQCSPQTIGIILTLYVNYGLSSRKTSMFMNDIFGIKISHQTIMNYAEAVASKVQNLVINYKYSLGNILVGDETYIKVSGKNKYVFFFSDPKSKIITSWKIYDNRDTKNAVESILMSLNKYPKIPDNFQIITDANPIYNAAQVFLNLNDINFDLQQVIGVSNKDEVSRLYRPYKQIEERLNRTYKQNYYGTNGYSTLKNANIYMILYVTFFNFLRRHSTLNYNPPVKLEILNETALMQDKWVSLINLSDSYSN